MKDWNIDNSWTLFLDRDGVINQRLKDNYVTGADEFEFLDGALAAFGTLAAHFKTIAVVTNQQGIGKGLMTEDDLIGVHAHMLECISDEGGRIDEIYHCAGLASNNPACRKPEIGMAKEAQEDFPNIDFAKSIMVGDTLSDMKFGENAGMKRVFITTNGEDHTAGWEGFADAAFVSLGAFAAAL